MPVEIAGFNDIIGYKIDAPYIGYEVNTSSQLDNNPVNLSTFTALEKKYVAQNSMVAEPVNNIISIFGNSFPKKKATQYSGNHFALNGK